MHQAQYGYGGTSPESEPLTGTAGRMGPGHHVDAAAFLNKVYGWMSLGLFITAAISTLMALQPELTVRLVMSGMFHVLLLAEIILVVYLSGWIRSMQAGTAGTVFVLYSMLNGVTLSILFLVYTSASIASTFVLCSATFGAMSIYGYTTKKDLSSVGSFCMMGLFGVIIASVFNMFFASSAVYWATTYIGIAVFIGLTAWDTQKIKLMAHGSFGDEAMASKASILGALTLYLDFVNLFLYLLRIFGNRRR